MSELQTFLDRISARLRTRGPYHFSKFHKNSNLAPIAEEEHVFWANSGSLKKLHFEARDS